MKSARVFGRRHSISCILSRGREQQVNSWCGWRRRFSAERVSQQTTCCPQRDSAPSSAYRHKPIASSSLLTGSLSSATWPINRRQSGRVVAPPLLEGSEVATLQSICLSRDEEVMSRLVCLSPPALIIRNHEQCCWDYQ